MKVAGSLFSFFGTSDTGVSGLTIALAVAAVGGGDTGRVAARSDAVEGFVSAGGFEKVALAVPVSWFVDGALPLDMFDPRRALGSASRAAGAACSAGRFALSSSLRRFATGSGSYAAVAGDWERRLSGDFAASWLKMQCGNAQLAPEGHAMLLKLRKAVIEGHMMVVFADALPRVNTRVFKMVHDLPSEVGCVAVKHVGAFSRQLD